jgi:hypothetical protein
MKTFLMTAVALGATIAAAAPAEAAGGCGAGFHRGPYGGCRPNRPVAVRPAPAPVLVVGRYYPGRGYWYRNRYWANRYRYHGYWRYR